MAAVLAIVVAASGLVTAAPSPVAAAAVFFDEDWSYGPNLNEEQNEVVYGGIGRFAPGAFDGAYYLNSTYRFRAIPDGSRLAIPDESEDYAYYFVPGQGTLPTVTVSGANGVVGIPSAGAVVDIVCRDPDLIDLENGTRRCSIPSGSYQISVSWSFLVQDGPCVRAALGNPSDPPCPMFTVSGESVRTVLPGSPENQPPNAAFDARPSSTNPLEVDFESRSTDPETDPESLAHQWDFGDGTTSFDRNPTHVYPRKGNYVVTLVVTDPGGRTSTASSTVSLDPQLIVNSTGDSPAQDPTRGCDTGGTVGDPAVTECTLRAAIEAAKADGGGAIGFAIDGDEVPSIPLGGSLPEITSDTVIDGTSQEGGFVRVTGGGEDGQLVLAGGTSELRGLVFDEGEVGVRATGGADHVVEGNRFGTDAGGLVAGDLEDGVVVDGADGVAVRDNVMVAGNAAVAVGDTADGTEISDNAIGVDATGEVGLGATAQGILVLGPNTVISGNTVGATTLVGIEVATDAAVGVRVEGNQVGVSRSGTARLDGAGYGIRLDGSPGTIVSGNKVVAGRSAGILAAGTLQLASVDDDTIEYAPPLSPFERDEVTGSATIAGNTVGVLADGSSAGGVPVGVWLYEGMADSTVAGNTVAGVGSTGVLVDGGSGNTVADNEIGTVGGAVVQPVPQLGVDVKGSTGATIGGEGTAGNEVTASSTGVTLGPFSNGATVIGNQVTGTEATTTGVSGANVTGLTVTLNQVQGGRKGITAGRGAIVTGNVVEDFSEVGIEALGDTVEVRDNTVVENGDGIASGVTVGPLPATGSGNGSRRVRCWATTAPASASVPGRVRSPGTPWPAAAASGSSSPRPPRPPSGPTGSSTPPATRS